MKRQARKFVSLLLALALVFSLVPAAWAADASDTGGETPPADTGEDNPDGETPGGGEDPGGTDPNPPAVPTTPGTITSTVSVSASPASITTAGSTEVTASVRLSEGESVTGISWEARGGSLTTISASGSAASWTTGFSAAAAGTYTVVAAVSISKAATDTTAANTATITGSTTVTVTAVPAIVLTPNPANDNNTVVELGYLSNFQSYGRTFSVTSNVPAVSYVWTLNNYTIQSASNSSTITLFSSDLSSGTNTLSCTAVDSAGNKSAPVTWTIRNSYYSQMSIGVTVYDTSSGYALGDEPDEGSTGSVIAQINNWLSRNSRNEYIYSLSFSANSGGGFSSSSGTNGYLNVASNQASTNVENIVFQPAVNLTNSSSAATASYSFVLTTRISGSYNTSYGNTYYGTLTFTIKQGTAAGGSITYSARTGENVTLDSARFQSFWTQNFPSGALSYVEFTSISGGSLYSGYNGSKGTSVVSSSNPTPCYVNPSSRQTGLDGLTMVPSSSSRNSTVTIRFTARGTSRGSGSATSSRTGTVTIVYMNSSAAITYDAAANGTVTLDPNDFTSAYRSAVGGSVPSSITIRFTSLPQNGTLTYQSGSNRSVTLTSSNMSSYDFSSRTSGSSRISDVTYTAGRSGAADTAEFVCYSGGTPRFMGTITFNSKPQVVENLSVQFQCTSSSGIPINAMSFYNSSNAVSSSAYITFGVPSSGSLYLNGAALNSSTRLSFVSGSGYPLFSNVTYQPASNTANGTVTFPFSAYNANEQLVASGTVSIAVDLPVTPTAPATPAAPSTPSAPTIPTTPSTPAVQLKDVPAGSWYATYVNALVSAKVIGGYNDGTFRPANDVTYGEALALIMRAVGYEIQQGAGSNWAMPYLTKAAADGLLPTNAAYGLSDAVDRYTIAQITAKAMKLTPVTNADSSPFSDTSDPYVLALHNAGIIGGTGSGFEGSKTLSRAEVSAIIYRIYEKNAAAQQPAESQQPEDPAQPEETTQPSDGSDREPDRDAPWGY